MMSTRNAPQADQAPAAAKWLPGPDGNTIPATATAEASPSTAQTTPASHPEFVAAATAPKAEAPADPAPASGPSVVAAAPAHPGKHGSWIQLATFRSEQNAKDQLKTTMSSNQDLLHGLPVTLRRVDLGAEKGVYYLLRVGPMESLAQAHDLCSAFKDRKIDCVIAK
jgi:cell division septation protein DedD